jgi:Cu+-exporting ATPase
MAKATFPVTGMTCAACQSFVQRTLEQQPGVRSATVNLMLNNATVVFDPEAVSPVQLVEAVQKTGYGASLPVAARTAVEDQRQLDQTQDEDYQSLLRRTIATLLAGAIAMALPMDHRYQWLSFALALAVIIFAGRRFYVKAWAAARHGVSDMNTLIALGTGAAFLFSTAAMLLPSLGQQVYFEAVIFILGLVLAGNTMEARAKKKTSASLRELASLRPKTVHALREDSEVELPVEEVAPGEILLVRPGERIAADGVIVHGSGPVDESILTGESMPIEKQPGEKVFAGSLNQSSALRYRVEAAAADSTLEHILRLLREAQGQRAPIQRLADRISAVFVPVVLAIAVLTFLAWYLHFAPGEPQRAFTCAVAVLIISCPCAMGLAVPTAVMVATGRAAKLGLLIRGGEALERLGRIDTILLDKTGTVTEGRPAVRAFLPDHSALAPVAALESASEHPLAQSIVRYAQQNNIVLAQPDFFRALAGAGAEGRVNGEDVLAGKRELLEDRGIDCTPLAAAAEQHSAAAETVIWFVVGGKLAAIAALADPPRATSKAAIARMQSAGIRTVLLTGDNTSTANAIAAQVGISEVIAGVLPAGKKETVERFQREGCIVAMAGDGINDAPALAQADVGIAVGGGADVAMEAADVTLLRGDLRGVSDAVELSRTALRIMRQNLFWAFLYNVIAIPVAASGRLSPILASAAMAFSSVSVITNSLRLSRAGNFPR